MEWSAITEQGGSNLTSTGAMPSVMLLRMLRLEWRHVFWSEGIPFCLTIQWMSLDLRPGRKITLVAIDVFS